VTDEDIGDEALETARLTGLASGLETSIVTWWHGLKAQRERLANGLDDMTPARLADVSLFVVALRNVHRVVWRCHVLWDKPNDEPFKDAIDEFDRQIPHSLDIRNILEHFDKQQSIGEYSVFVTNDPQGWLSIHVNQYRLDVNEAVDHAKVLMTRCAQLLHAVRTAAQ
jgi:hypothetical protein